jgi:phage tail-like protein
MGGVLALALGAETLHVGDNAGRRILSFALSEGFPFCGEAAGFRGFVTALAVTPAGDVLLASTGDAGRFLELDAAGAYIGAGVLWSDAISADPSAVAWHRLQAFATTPASSHLTFHYALSNQQAPPPVDPTADDPFADHGWSALPEDANDFFLSRDKARHLFVGVQFTSDRTATPRLEQIRADFDVESYTRYLPAIYRPATGESDFLCRFVSLLQGMFEDIEDEVATLDRYFDPFAAPAEALPWLAAWLALEPDMGEPGSRIRSGIAGAFRRYRWRGTVEGLRLALLEDAAVHATVSEPIAAAAFWAMPPEADCSGITPPDGPALGLGTYLPSMQPGGAVLGSTAELDHARLITDAEFGEPLFAGTAWQFVVEVHRREVATPARLQLVKDIIEREKPAHTMYRLALIGPSMRVGAQARVGVDSVVAGTPGPAPLGSTTGLRLAGSLSPKIGTSRLGDDLKL